MNDPQARWMGTITGSFRNRSSVSFRQVAPGGIVECRCSLVLHDVVVLVSQFWIYNVQRMAGVYNIQSMFGLSRRARQVVFRTEQEAWRHGASVSRIAHAGEKGLLQCALETEPFETVARSVLCHSESER